jgi:methylated-DNA-[protein]-cysteine S-methyltransferase
MDHPVDCDASVVAFETQLGWMAIAWTQRGLARFTLGHPSAQAALISSGGEPTAMEAAPRSVQSLSKRFQDYAAGREVTFDDVQLDLSHLTAFQQRIVTHCRKIARGASLSYGELAARAGSPGAARAVGSVMAKNRFPIVVPCHRVVGSGGGLGGFSAPTGVSLKTRMLALEGCALASSARKPKRPELVRGRG